MTLPLLCCFNSVKLKLLKANDRIMKTSFNGNVELHLRVTVCCCNTAAVRDECASRPRVISISTVLRRVHGPAMLSMFLQWKWTANVPGYRIKCGGADDPTAIARALMEVQQLAAPRACSTHLHAEIVVIW